MAAKKKSNLKEASRNALFTKMQLLASDKFTGRKDIINALLSDEKEYTVEAVEEKITKYMKGKVN